MKNIKIIILGIITLAQINILLGSNFAEAFNPNEYCPINSPFCQTTEVSDDPVDSTINLLQVLSSGLLYFAAPIAVLSIVIAGIRMSANSGSPENLGESKKTLIWSVAGLAVIILSYSIVQIVISFTIKAAS